MLIEITNTDSFAITSITCTLRKVFFEFAKEYNIFFSEFELWQKVTTIQCVNGSENVDTDITL